MFVVVVVCGGGVFVVVVVVAFIKHINKCLNRTTLQKTIFPKVQNRNC